MREAEKCAEYFRSKAGYARIMEAIYKQYCKYGETKGNVVLSDASSEECDAANEIVDPKRPFAPPLIKFSLRDFEAGLKNTRFGNTDLRYITEAYLGKRIVTKKEISVAAEEIKNTVFNRVREINSGCYCEKWLEKMIAQKDFGYKTVTGEINVSPGDAEKMLGNICMAINSRQNAEPVQLAVLSAEITGDSHYFDNTRTAGKLLLKGLACTVGMPESKYAEEEKVIYAKFGIEPDSVSSMTAAVGIRLYKSDMCEHPAFKIFADTGEICLISMANLMGISGADTDGKVVIAVENPMVFTALSGAASEYGCGLICTAGQLKTSGIRLLQMLAESGCKILYAGDFDPEGLQIADKILRRFSEYDVHAWHMSAEDYNAIEKGDELSEKRLNKLNSIRSHELVSAVNAIRSERRAAYQELLVSQMIYDISHGLLDMKCTPTTEFYFAGLL